MPNVKGADLEVGDQVLNDEALLRFTIMDVRMRTSWRTVAEVRWGDGHRELQEFPAHVEYKVRRAVERNDH